MFRGVIEVFNVWKHIYIIQHYLPNFTYLRVQKNCKKTALKEVHFYIKLIKCASLVLLCTANKIQTQPVDHFLWCMDSISNHRYVLGFQICKKYEFKQFVTRHDVQRMTAIVSSNCGMVTSMCAQYALKCSSRKQRICWKMYVFLN
jgi:hypothetical protein